MASESPLTGKRTTPPDGRPGGTEREATGRYSTYVVGKTGHFGRAMTVASIAVASAITSSARAESASAPPERQQMPQPHVESVSVALVLVAVVVRSGDDYVGNLEQDDFELLVDGRPVAIDMFERRTDAPTSIVILQDLSGSMANSGKLEVSRQIVQHMIDTAGADDEFAIVTFASGQARVEVPFTSERRTLLEALATWRGYGTTGLHDAVAWLPEISLAGRRPKKAALLLTDGIDNASELSAVSARTVVREAQLPVYVFGMTAGTSGRPAASSESETYSAILRQLAERTAGRYYSLEREADWREAVLEVADDLRHQYVLGFTLGTGVSAYREIDVLVSGRSARDVIARRGYSGPPPAGPGR